MATPYAPGAAEEDSLLAAIPKKVLPPWDPLTSLDWDKEKHSSVALVRIQRDLQNIFKDPSPGICVLPDGDDLTRLHVLITGPFDTPYEGGFFHYYLRYPPTYPLTSPRVKFMTTGCGTVRFNPNLYRNGKVCLSILGTWHGPPWSPTQSLQSVLLSIQTLMNEKPYHNEPGFEREHNPGEVEHYNDIIRHETLRVAVCDALENNKCPPDLFELKKSTFVSLYECYMATATETASRLDGQPMMDPFRINKGTFNFKKIISRLEKLFAKYS
ncbi:ubiquitin-conjugating enzyme E2 Z-like [Halichondria panicea]|uniref:ubiquitin-conjugating enzyme E2 Z-like n=1 Tax=Halichondria panicea TaxID=6063 RepID=UPI00312B6C9F